MSLYISFMKLVRAFNVKKQCKSYGVHLWQCPQFLFIVMGGIIIFTILISYFLGTRYIIDPYDPMGPYLISLIVISLSLILFTLSYIITQSFERLAQASRLKSEFINIISHQLRSPITNIKWIAEFLVTDQKDMTTEKRGEYFSHLKDNISRMVELVDELLIISKLEEGTFPLTKKKGSLSKTVQGLVDSATAFARASNIKLEYECQKNLPDGFFDSTMLKLVIENLIDNAIRYTRKGKKIKISLKESNGKFIFKIKDGGVGIPKKDQPLIFQKFFRSENALKNETKGSGLGLYIARLIVTKSGGKIWFESEEGKGTTFYFVLPVK